MMLLAVVQHAVGLAELVNGRDDDLAHVLPEQLCSSRGRGLHQVRHVRRVEGGADLRVEVDAVHHDHDRGIAQLGCMRSFCAAKTISRILPLSPGNAR
jgi:hypothetical protein